MSDLISCILRRDLLNYFSYISKLLLKISQSKNFRNANGAYFWSQDDFFYKVTASLAPHVVQGPRLDAKNLQGTKLFAAVKSIEGLQVPTVLFSPVQKRKLVNLVESNSRNRVAD